MDYFTLVTAGRNRNIFGECHQNNLMCTTHRLTDDTIVHKSIMFLRFCGVQFLVSKRARLSSLDIKIPNDLDDGDIRRSGQLSRIFEHH